VRVFTLPTLTCRGSRAELGWNWKFFLRPGRYTGTGLRGLEVEIRILAVIIRGWTFYGHC
jgi:hypothetical protein